MMNRFRRDRPRKFDERTVLQHRVLSLMLLGVAVFGVVTAILFGDQSIGIRLRWPAVLVTVICASFAYQAHWRARGARTVLEAIPRLAAMHPPELLAGEPARLAGDNPPPGPEFDYLDVARLPRRIGRLRRVTGETNVFGFSPLRILHLWVFQSEGRIVDYLAGTWREIGSVNLLRSVSSLAPGLGRDEANHNLDAVLVHTQVDVDVAIEAFDYASRRRGMNDIESVTMSDIQVLDRFGSYPVNSLLCHDEVWQYALHRMLDGADLVTMDLAGFSQDHSGAEYEIGYLIDHFPMDRVLFLVDRTFDRAQTEAALSQSWVAMAEDSPNRDGLSTIRVIETRGMYQAGGSPQAPIEARAVGAGKTDARRIVSKLLAEGVFEAPHGETGRATDTSRSRAGPYVL